MSGSLRVTVLLTFAPDERVTHDSLIAAASTLCASSPGALLEMIQLAPAAGRVDARVPSVGAAASWWEFTSPGAGEDAGAQALYELAREALASEGLRDAGQRLVLFAPGPATQELAALLASDADGCALGRCTDVRVEDGTVIARRAAFGGRVELELRTHAGFCTATWRGPASTQAVLQPPPPVSFHSAALSAAAASPEEAEPVASADALPRLEGAVAVVSGGRGMDGPEGFALLERVAASLDAALGGSLPAVDAGWMPVARQIGQSGKFVSPRLYFGVGVSGTPQHLAGISPETCIVALNKDPDAAIFGVAEVGVVGDWREILPLLAEQLEGGQKASS